MKPCLQLHNSSKNCPQCTGIPSPKIKIKRNSVINKVKIIFSLSTQVVGADDELHLFFISVLDGGQRSNSCPIGFITENESRYPVTTRVGFKARLYDLGKGKIHYTCPDSNPKSSTLISVLTCLYNNCAPSPQTTSASY